MMRANVKVQNVRALRGPDPKGEVIQVAEKKISPKAAASKSAKSTKKAAATRVTKRASLKKFKKA